MRVGDLGELYLLNPSIVPSPSYHRHLLLTHLPVTYSDVNAAEASPQISYDRNAASENAMKLLHWCPHLALCFILLFLFFKAELYVLEKKDRVRCRFKGSWGSGGAARRQKYDGVTAVLTLPGCRCVGRRGGVGAGGGGRGGSLTCQRVRGWLKDSASPFQLQQLPIYIVMQIHGPSQMVLFQHRGCIEI